MPKSTSDSCCDGASSRLALSCSAHFRTLIGCWFCHPPQILTGNERCVVMGTSNSFREVAEMRSAPLTTSYDKYAVRMPNLRFYEVIAGRMITSQ